MNPYRPYAVRLVAREQVSPSFVRITLAGDDLGTCGDVLLDQRVKLVLGSADALDALAGDEDWYATWLALPDTERPAVRTYTLVAVRAGGSGASDASGEVDIDVVVHPVAGSAPGMDFATDAPLGSPAVLVAGDTTRPGHDMVGVAWHPGEAGDLLLVGDETALPAILNIAATLAPTTTGRLVLEVPRAADARPVEVPAGVRVEWRVRERGERAMGVFGRPAGEVADDGDLLWDEVAAPASGWYGWVAGEAGWVRELRAEARAAGVPKGQVAFMGYWKRGVAGS